MSCDETKLEDGCGRLAPGVESASRRGYHRLKHASRRRHGSCVHAYAASRLLDFGKWVWSIRGRGCAGGQRVTIEIWLRAKADRACVINGGFL